MTLKKNEVYAKPLWTLRSKSHRFQLALSKCRLGIRGKRALSRLLNAEELPFDKLWKRYERAYQLSKRKHPTASEEFLNSVIVERRFQLPGVNRYITLLVLPFPSIEGAEHGKKILVDSIMKRYNHLLHSKVSEIEIDLVDFPDARVVETRGENTFGAFQVLSIGNVVGSELLIVEFQSATTGEWSASDCDEIIHLQIAKMASKM